MPRGGRVPPWRSAAGPVPARGYPPPRRRRRLRHRRRATSRCTAPLRLTGTRPCSTQAIMSGSVPAGSAWWTPEAGPTARSRTTRSGRAGVGKAATTRLRNPWCRHGPAGPEYGPFFLHNEFEQHRRWRRCGVPVAGNLNPVAVLRATHALARFDGVTETPSLQTPAPRLPADPAESGNPRVPDSPIAILLARHSGCPSGARHATRACP